MQYINQEKIFNTIEKTKNANNKVVLDILAKTKTAKRLSLEETAILLNVEDEGLISEIYKAARELKDDIYGNRVVLFTPLYTTNNCVNKCLYCGFQCDNKAITRKTLTPQEVTDETEWMLKRGHMRILMVAGEATADKNYINHLLDSIKAIYKAEDNGHSIKRVNVNAAPLSTEDFRKLKEAGIGTYQLFQETYHEETYRKMHVFGPKSDPDYRISTMHRAFEAGIDDYGIGVLYGLYDYKFETLAMLMHVEELERTLGVGPHTISMPRLEDATGVDVDICNQYPLSDDEFKKLVAVLRLSVPYTGLIMSTRETAELRDELLDLGVSQISAESSTTPAGHTDAEDGGQFETHDSRGLEELVQAMLAKGYLPSFCAACYRKDRTGETFMDITTHGHIKSMCSINGLSTLKEYLRDFAGEETQRMGDAFIERMLASLPDKENCTACDVLERVEKGEKDVFV